MRASTKKALLVGLLSAATVLALAVTPARAADPLVAAVGDIACSSLPTNPDSCQQQATSDLLVGKPLSAVLMLGDGSYEDGTLAQYQTYYDPTWGRFKSITHPATGNHEYQTPGAQGYYQYFGPAAGDPSQGWYSYDVGTWHMIVLNSNCYVFKGCGANTPQVQWLKADLAAHKNSCTLAYYHHPHFTSGSTNDDNSGHNPTGAFWDALYAAGADVILNGHDHDYERFGAQSPIGEPDPAYGIREFIVGTGGRSYNSFLEPSLNSEVREGRTYGVLFLTLHPTSYDWRFVPVPGKTFTDSGTGRCHGGPNEPVLKVNRPTRRKISRRGTLRVYLTCAATCATRTQMAVTIGRRKIRSRTVARTLVPETRSGVRVTFSRSALGMIQQAFKKRKRLKAEVNARASVVGIEKSGSARLLMRLQR